MCFNTLQMFLVKVGIFPLQFMTGLIKVLSFGLIIITLVILSYCLSSCVMFQGLLKKLYLSIYGI